MQNHLDSLETRPPRRRFLTTCTAIAGGVMLSRSALAAAPPKRALNLLNLHTQERLSLTFWADGKFDPGALARIDHLLRDHRTDEQHPIDHSLLHLLHRLQEKIGHHKEIHVVSGYRSPRTNAMLRKVSDGVAKRSLHTLGRAVDIRVPHVTTRQLFELAKRLRGGGVGRYDKSAFVHLDTGRVRYW